MGKGTSRRVIAKILTTLPSTTTRVERTLEILVGRVRLPPGSPAPMTYAEVLSGPAQVGWLTRKQLRDLHQQIGEHLADTESEDDTGQ